MNTDQIVAYLRGDSYSDSDIDIVVELEEPDIFALIGIKQQLEEQFCTKVDIVRLRNRMNQSLRTQIEKDAIYV